MKQHELLSVPVHRTGIWFVYLWGSAQFCSKAHPKIKQTRRFPPIQQHLCCSSLPAEVSATLLLIIFIQSFCLQGGQKKKQKKKPCNFPQLRVMNFFFACKELTVPKTGNSGMLLAERQKKPLGLACQLNVTQHLLGT